MICFYCSGLPPGHIMFDLWALITIVAYTTRIEPFRRGSCTQIKLSKQWKRRLFCVYTILDIPKYEWWLIYKVLSSYRSLQLPSDYGKMMHRVLFNFMYWRVWTFKQPLKEVICKRHLWITRERWPYACRSVVTTGGNPIQYLKCFHFFHFVSTLLEDIFF